MRVLNYYNENDPFAAQWLRNLIAADLIANGEVDERSIKEVTPADVRGFNQCHFFAGIGGWSYALRLAGWPDDEPAWTGSCPCQPFSASGSRLGASDPRHLWPEFARLIGECTPTTVLGEQVAAKAGREWLSGVRTDLEEMGYAVGAADLCAAGVGSPHIRQRLFWVADATLPAPARQRLVSEQLHGKSYWDAANSVWTDKRKRKRRFTSGIQPLAHGVSGRMGLLRGYGNAIVPQVAAEFISAFMECRP